MKKILCAFLLSSLTGVSFGQNFYEDSASGAQEYPVAASGFFAGGTVEYLIDGETEYFTGHIGVDAGSGASYFLEIGYLDEDLSSGGVSAELTIVPITVNIAFEKDAGNSLSLFYGAGIGIGFIDIEASNGISRIKDDATALIANAFLGVSYQLSEQASIYAQARYLYRGEADFDAGTADDGDDVSLGAGFRIRF